MDLILRLFPSDCRWPPVCCLGSPLRGRRRRRGPVGILLCLLSAFFCRSRAAATACRPQAAQWKRSASGLGSSIPPVASPVLIACLSCTAQAAVVAAAGGWICDSLRCFWWLRDNSPTVKYSASSSRRGRPRSPATKVLALPAGHFRAAHADAPARASMVTTRRQPHGFAAMVGLPRLARRSRVDITLSHNFTALQGPCVTLIHDVLQTNPNGSLVQSLHTSH